MVFVWVLPLLWFLFAGLAHWWRVSGDVCTRVGVLLRLGRFCGCLSEVVDFVVCWRFLVVDARWVGEEWDGRCLFLSLLSLFSLCGDLPGEVVLLLVLLLVLC